MRIAEITEDLFQSAKGIGKLSWLHAAAERRGLDVGRFVSGSGPDYRVSYVGLAGLLARDGVTWADVCRMHR